MSKSSILIADRAGLRKKCSFDDALAFLRKGKESSDAPFWIDFAAPSKQQLRAIADVAGIHALTVEDILSKRVREKSESFDDYLYVISHGLNFNPGEKLLDTLNVSFVVFPMFVLTFHHKSLNSVEMAIARIEEEFHGKLPSEDWILYAILDAVVDLYEEEVTRFCDMVDQLDEDVLLFHEPAALLDRIGAARKMIFQFRRRLAPKKEFLQSLCNRDHPTVSRPTTYLLRDIYDHTIRMQEMLDIARETITSAQSNYLAHTSNQMNLVMKALSLVATIMLPLSLVAGLFGMNVRVPGQDHPGYLWFIGLVATMAFMGWMMTHFFRRRGWF